jgi:ABC-type nitrate/sulfonate/bicarbonate transport system ATPase subunit
MLEARDVSFGYRSRTGDVLPVLSHLSLSLPKRQFATLVGPSGCGKSSFLKLIAGLEKPTGGSLLFRGAPIRGPSRERGLIFQDYTLFPWSTVRGNISFGPKVRRLPRDEQSRIVNHYLSRTGLSAFAHAFPRELSGGMQQRVAIARTLAADPSILLMDEPFGALDAQTRSSMQDFLVDLWETEHKTVLFVTHDVAEAIFLGDILFILGPRPAAVRSILHVPFARPRRHELKRSPAFFECVRHVTTFLENITLGNEGDATQPAIQTLDELRREKESIPFPQRVPTSVYSHRAENLPQSVV